MRFSQKIFIFERIRYEKNCSYIFGGVNYDDFGYPFIGCKEKDNMGGGKFQRAGGKLAQKISKADLLVASLELAQITLA